jgi:uncharacterized protein YaaR (DUF327 family)
VPEKRILIVPTELLRKIDENRGDMTRVQLIEFLIGSQLEQGAKAQRETKCATREELRLFKEDVKQFLRSVLDYSVSYWLKPCEGLPKAEKASPKTEFEELTAELRELEP